MVLQMVNKGFFSRMRKVFFASIESHWSEKELLFLNSFEIRFSIHFFFFVHLFVSVRSSPLFLIGNTAKWTSKMKKYATTKTQ